MKKKEHLNEMENDMQDWLPKTGNMKNLLEPVAESSAKYSQNLDDLYKSRTFNATAKEASIKEIGRPLGVYKNENDSIELYLARVKAAYRQIINNGTPQDIIESVSLLLNISQNSIELKNLDSVQFEVQVPTKALTEKSFTEAQVESLFNRLSAATYEISITTSGTLSYITPSEYNSGATGKGYADNESQQDSEQRGTYREVL